MAGRVRIVVKPSDSVLTVQDAMLHVYDFFELLITGSDTEDFAWTVVDASTNSPFSLEAEASSSISDVDVSLIALTQCGEVERGLRSLAKGRVPPTWRDTPREEIAKRICKRNMNGISETDIFFERGEKPFSFTQENAVTGLRALEAPARTTPDYLQFKGKRDEFGTIEGDLIRAGSHYDKPAIQIRDRKRGSQIWCIVTQEQKDKIASQAHIEDVWAQKRVRIKGTIHYKGIGVIDRVTATNIEIVSPPKVKAGDVADKQFTGGMTAAEYLERFREGDLG